MAEPGLELKDDLVASISPDPEVLTATLEGEPFTLVATLDVPADLLSTLEDVATLSPTLEDDDELVSELGHEQGPRGPRGFRGVPGPEGEPGRDGAPGGALSRVSVGPISGGRAVVAVDADRVDVASALRSDDAARVLGVAPFAVSEAGTELEVVRLGTVSDASWSFAPGLRVFVGPSGELTQAVSFDWAFVLPVGTALSAQVIFVDVGEPTFLGRSA